MKFNFPLLKRCAFAAALLSVSHFAGYAEETDEKPLASLPQEELIATAEENVFTDTLFDALGDDLLLNDEEFASTLVAGSGKKNKKRRKKNRQSSEEQLELSQASNTWVPKFVWMGEVDNSEDLKCFATFLIGSMSNQNGNTNGQAAVDSGVFMTPNATAKSDYNPSSANNNIVARHNKASAQYRGGNSRGNNARGNNAVTTRGAPLPRARLSLDFHGGANFLYFSKYKGNIAPQPNAFFANARSGGGSNLPVKGRVHYDVTPLFEMDAIFNVFRWLGFGPYAQTSQGTVIRTDVFNAVTDSTAQLTPNTPVFNSFYSTLDLNAVGGKLVFNFPNLVRFRTWCMGIYLGAGGSVAFQTWKNEKGSIETDVSVLTTDDFYQSTISWNTRYMTNFGYTGDVALSFRSRNPYSMMTALKFGCKFIGWGRTNGLGKAQSPGHIVGYWKPISFQNIFSVAPYMGFSWSF